MYIYKQTEPQLWTVGHYDPNGKFIPESDHPTEGQASGRVMQLNGGGTNQQEVEIMKKLVDVACEAHYQKGVRAAAAIVQTMIGELSEEQYKSHKEILEIAYTSINKLKV